MIGVSTLNLSIEQRGRHVSKFVTFEYDPIDQLAAFDPVERRTWCALRIRVGHRFVSRIWDKSLQAERTTLYLPAFPIAEWIVQNWWSLLNELCPWEMVPRSRIDATRIGWIKRHCLRSADSALLLPELYLFHDGQSFRAEWQSDLPDSMPNMPGEFINDGADQLDTDATQECFAQFVNDILGHAANLNDDRVIHVTNQWRAIRSADDEERQFCTLAGRMGINPYDQNEMTEGLALFLEESITNAQEPLVRDLTEVARPESIEPQWSWIKDISQDLHLGPNPVDPPFTLPPRRLSPPKFGYQLALKVRASANIETEPLGSVEEVAQDVVHGRFRVEDRNHVPGQGILAIVGRSSSGDIVTAGPQSPHSYNQRFLIARSVYHALVTSTESQRLVTKAYSWDQKASRAFAAELLAPQRALVNRLVTTTADPQMVEELSKEFKASTMVIEKQLDNAGIPLSYD